MIFSMSIKLVRLFTESLKSKQQKSQAINVLVRNMILQKVFLMIKRKFHKKMRKKRYQKRFQKRIFFLMVDLMKV